MIPDPNEQATMRVEELAVALGVARSTLYDAVAKGEVPSIRLGRRVLLPTAGVRRWLQLDAAVDDGEDFPPLRSVDGGAG